MFLPGAQYVAYSIVIFASLLTCICGGAIGVVLGSGLASKLLPKTKTYTKMVQGYEAPKGGYPFWVHKIVWMRAGFIIFFCLSVYVAVGPTAHLIGRIGG